MKNLYEPLPTGVKVNGRLYGINTSFRVWLQAEKVMGGGDLPQAEQIALLISLCYKEPASCCTCEHVEKLLEFYRCGREIKADETGHTAKPAYDFEQDADYIYAAFMQEYGIDLFKTDLHWWAFRALFASLPEGCTMSRIMGYRTADTRDMSKGQKKFYKRMQRLYALKPKTAPKRRLTLEERDKMWLDKVNAVYEQAKGGGNNG